ncbi:MAG: BrnT family toxin [Pseudomonadota bacterium]
MAFEYDDKKSSANKIKHGIDFEEAKDIWNDEYRLEIGTNGLSEPRYLVIGVIDKNLWSAIITYRDGNIRIISVRRSRIEEVRIYDGF